MADIFISYSSKHRDLTRELAATLEHHFGDGSVWWDQAGLRGGDRFSPEITRALDESKAVVVIWTEGAVSSDWVYAEAVRAAAKRKIVTVCAPDLDHDRIPLPFNVFHNCLVHDTPAIIAAIEGLRTGTPSLLPSTLPGKGFRAFLLDPKQEVLPPHAIATRPASLLLAKHRLVPFDDFHGVRRAFVEWAISAPPYAMGRRALGRLVHAPAGLGKTRALIEIAEELTDKQGWLAGFVPRDVRGAGRELSEAALERLIIGGGDAAGLMLIVDYAESRQDDVTWLAEKLLKRAEIVPKPSRLVLLSRGSGVWWNELLLKNQSLQDLCSLGDDRFDEYRISEDIAVHDRRALFDASVRAFTAYQGAITTPREIASPTDDQARAIESDPDYDRPLALQIAALLHVAGVEASGGERKTAGLLSRILGLEYEYWDKTLGIAEQPNWQHAIKNGVACATLVGGVESAERAEGLIALDPFFDAVRDIDRPRALDALRRLFPAENGGLAALEPDLIGEHHVLSVLSESLVDACLEWTREGGNKRQQILTVLNRATRGEHGDTATGALQQLTRLIHERAATLGGDLIRVALETPGHLLDLCPALQSHLMDLDREALTAIDDALPLQSLALMDVSLAVAERLANLMREMTRVLDSRTDGNDKERDVVLSEFAAHASTLGVRLSSLGRREEALAATQEAVDIYRRLVDARPDAHLPDLAGSLNNLGIRLFKLGQREEALAATQEAVGIRRRLAQAWPEAFLPNLATSLNNLGNLLSERGRREEALAASQEALDTYRRLALAHPDAFLPDLATSLNNISVDLSNLGRHDEALAASQEAVGIRRRLALARPDAFLADLAGSLNNLGNRLSNLGHRDEALAAAQEAVEIRRRLVQARHDAFMPDLATSLGALNRALVALKRHRDAAAATHEALSMLAPFVERHPQAFDRLARGLGADYLAAAEKSSIEPDAALLERVARALGAGDTSPA